MRLDDENATPQQGPAEEDQPLSDTQAELHQEGKSLSDHDKDLGEKLAEIMGKPERDD